LDIEGSTRLLDRLGDDYGVALDGHRRVLRTVFERHGGIEVGLGGRSVLLRVPLGDRRSLERS